MNLAFFKWLITSSENLVELEIECGKSRQAFGLLVKSGIKLERFEKLTIEVTTRSAVPDIELLLEWNGLPNPKEVILSGMPSMRLVEIWTWTLSGRPNSIGFARCSGATRLPDSTFLTMLRVLI